MGSFNGWWLGVIAALLACTAAVGLETRAISLENRLDAIESASPVSPAPAAAAAPSAIPVPEPTSVSAAEIVPPEVSALETQVDALESQADEAGLSDPDPAGRTRRRSVPAVAPASTVGASPAGVVLDPRIRQAARERAERELAKDRERLAEKKHEESEQKRQEMLQQFDMMKKMFGPDRAPRVAEKLMTKLGIAPEHREIVENAIRTMGTSLARVFDSARAKIQAMPEVTDEAMQTIFATQFGMAYMSAMTQAAREIKQFVPPENSKEIGRAVQEAIQPDPGEIQGMTGSGEGQTSGSDNPPPPEPVDEEPPK